LPGILGLANTYNIGKLDKLSGSITALTISEQMTPDLLAVILQCVTEILDLGNIYRNIGCALGKLNQLEEALSRYTMAWTIPEQMTPESLELANIYINIGNVYNRLKQPDKAYGFLHKI
jgi:tetratricopeptide (TPR) repeat protein